MGSRGSSRACSVNSNDSVEVFSGISIIIGARQIFVHKTTDVTTRQPMLVTLDPGVLVL